MLAAVLKDFNNLTIVKSSYTNIKSELKKIKAIGADIGNSRVVLEHRFHLLRRIAQDIHVLAEHVHRKFSLGPGQDRADAVGDRIPHNQRASGDIAEAFADTVTHGIRVAA